jgi:hypothetical protein
MTRNVHGLTRRQKGVLALLESKSPGVITTGATGLYDGQLWVNWRTAYSLHDRGLARVFPYGEEDAEVTLG